MSEWPLRIDGLDYHQIPQSWIDAPTAVDHDADAPSGVVRLYAVSAAVDGRWLLLRYAHPRGERVLARRSARHKKSDGSVYPYGLRGDGWPRSYVPERGEEPTGTIRTPEREHFETLWASRIGESEVVA